MKWFSGGHAEQVLQISVNEVRPNPYQPRKTFAMDSIDELSASIKEMGIIQPLVVRKMGSVYELVAGERRLRAAKAAGFATVPVVVKQYTDREVAQATLIENLQREDLNALEEALAYDQLLCDFNLTQEELAKRLGMSQSTVANKRRLLKLSDGVKDLLVAGALSERHARALLRLESQEVQATFATLAVKEDMTVKQLEEVVERFLSGESEREAVATATVKPIRRFFVRDVRIFVNSVRQAIDVMKKNGVAAQVEERHGETHYEFVVRIPK